MTSHPTWFGQPRGLTVLFLTNMWEQFSYYGMRALLIYYMTRELLLAQGTASWIYGTYTACAYFTPILGGAIADRWLGKRRAIVIGASVMAAGHFMMTFEPLLYVALATIALGNGLFLPTLPSQIDDLYEPGDPRVGWAYNVYYVGVNIGGFLAPLACGTLGEIYGWHYGFAAAGLGMLAGLVIYLWGQRYLPEQGRTVRPEASTHKPLAARTIALLFGVAFAVTLFRGAYEQAGNSFALWAENGVDRHAGTMTIPVTWFQSLNPLLVMAMTPLLLAWWAARARRGKVQPATSRMAQGALIVAAAYLLLAMVARGGPGQPWPWLLLFFAIYTYGELHILPTGLGLFARLAPKGLGATTVASWFLATFAGNLTAGAVGSLWSRMTPPGFFVMLAGLGVAAAAVLRLVGALVPLEAPDRKQPHESL